MKRILFFIAFLSACSSAKVSEPAKPVPPIESADAQKEMCVEDHIGIFRYSRKYLEDFCPSIKTQMELICLRFVHATKEYRKACPGVDTADKLECVGVLVNGTGFAQLESLQKCKNVQNRKQVFCLSRAVRNSGIALLPESVQECIDKNL